MSKARIYICKKCSNALVSKNVIDVSCCGEKMTEFIPNTTEAATEKHLPVVNVNENTIEVLVGEVSHPMTKEHYIGFIYLETQNGGQMKKLDVTSSPKTTFTLVDDKPMAVYEYCNLHGLWKINI